jgi:histidyl-tRNA synthetase
MTTLKTTLNEMSESVSDTNNLIGKTTDIAGSDSLYGKLAGVTSNVNTLISKWGNLNSTDIVKNLSGLQSYLGSPDDAAGQRTVFGKINEIAAQSGSIPEVAAVAQKTYADLQTLRQEVNFNGKSDSAYEMISKIGSMVTELRNNVTEIPKSSYETKLNEIADQIKKNSDMLAQTAMAVGQTEDGKTPATIQSLQTQIEELKSIIGIVKKSMEENQEPVIKTWLEKKSN